MDGSGEWLDTDPSVGPNESRPCTGCTDTEGVDKGCGANASWLGSDGDGAIVWGLLGFLAAPHEAALSVGWLDGEPKRTVDFLELVPLAVADC